MTGFDELVGYVDANSERRTRMMTGSWKDTTISKLTTTAAARWDTDFRALGPFIIGELVSLEVL